VLLEVRGRGVHKENGALWKITGNADDLHSGGRLCTRGTGGPGAYLDPDRLKTPLMRVTVDGRRRFQPVSWEEALDYISERMRGIADEHGPERMLMMSHGAGSSHFHHLLRAYGSDSTAEPSFAQCRGPGTWASG
jgi:thiosulfate reductase/polysulfide reductase chain A